MNLEVALFWAIAAGFLIFDNFLLIPVGGDYLSFRRNGKLHYSPASRAEVRGGRELIFLNPLNLFDRAALTNKILGPVNLGDYRFFRQEILQALPYLNGLACWGYSYLCVAILLAIATFNFGFERLLETLIGAHLFFWAMSSMLLLLWKKPLGLSPSQATAFAAESFFVPAYCINLGKRVWHRRSRDIPALMIGLHSFHRIHDESLRELLTHEYDLRLTHLSQDLPESELTTNRLIHEARACLTI
ncbi:hypothetical protein P3G55_23095 [Leptospira sp. 96542]|nr:hypothetical protein [Leptospira sp. 96542]